MIYIISEEYGNDSLINCQGDPPFNTDFLFIFVEKNAFNFLKSIVMVAIVVVFLDAWLPKDLTGIWSCTRMIR